MMFDLKINIYGINEKLNLDLTYELGREETIQLFFYNIAYNLENNKWGSVYPVIMNQFYKGKLEPKYINRAISEMQEIKMKLSELNISKMVYENGFTNGFGDKVQIKLDDWFLNSKRIKITDIILSSLKAHKSKKIPLYIGNYYLKEAKNSPIKKSIRIKQKLKPVFRYIIYILSVLIIKDIINQEQFKDFITKFIFVIIVVEIYNFYLQYKLKSMIKASKNKEIQTNKILIEKITLKRDLRSGLFDNNLDKINCPKTYEGIKETLGLKKITNWKKDLEKICQNLKLEEQNEIQELFEGLKEEYNFEYYEIADTSKIILKDNSIYRIIQSENEMYIFTAEYKK